MLTVQLVITKTTNNILNFLKIVKIMTTNVEFFIEFIFNEFILYMYLLNMPNPFLLNG